MAQNPSAISEEEEFEFRRRAEQEAAARKSAGPSTLDTVKGYASAVGRGAIKGVVGAAEQFIPPIYPRGTVGSKLVSEIDPTVEKGLNAMGLPQPETTGQKVVEGLSEFLPGMVTGRNFAGKLKTIPKTPEQLQNAARDAIVEAAKAEGYKLPGQNMFGDLGQMIAGRDVARTGMKVENQKVTNKIARREAGLGENESITDENLAAARERMMGPYNEVAAVSPEAKSALESMKQARTDARNQWRFYNSFGSSGYANPEVLAKAKAFDRLADFHEGIIEREAIRVATEQMQLAKPRGPGGRFLSPAQEGQKLGESLMADFQQARTNLAKNYAVDRANTPGGNVDAAAIARDKGKKSDGLKLISDFEQVRKPYFEEINLTPEVHIGTGFGIGHHAGLGLWARGLGTVGNAMSMSKLGQASNPQRNAMRDLNPSLLFGPGLGLQAPANSELNPFAE